MLIYEQHEEEEMAEAITRILEDSTGKKVLRFDITAENVDCDTLEAIVVFKDGSILDAELLVQRIKGRLACRVRGNFIRKAQE